MDKFAKNVKGFSKLLNKAKYLGWLDQMCPLFDAMGCLDYLNPCSPRFGQNKPPFLPDFEKPMLCPRPQAADG